jgi:hypothetical protein
MATNNRSCQDYTLESFRFSLVNNLNYGSLPHGHWYLIDDGLYKLTGETKTKKKLN